MRKFLSENLKKKTDNFRNLGMCVEITEKRILNEQNTTM
jgi:hypothetical protein